MGVAVSSAQPTMDNGSGRALYLELDHLRARAACKKSLMASLAVYGDFGSSMKEEDSEDWVLDSLDRYEKLHVFELQQPTRCMEWNHDGTGMFVAGFSPDKHNEFLQLLLPEKLLPPNMQTLLARRDFKIGRGAISQWPILHILSVGHLANSVIVTSGPRPELTVWGPDTKSPDLLVATGNITTPTPTLSSSDPSRAELQMSWCPCLPESLVCGGSMRTLQLIDLTTLTTTWSHPEGKEGDDTELHALQYLPQENTFITCTREGELTLWDTRLSESDREKGSLTFSKISVPYRPPEGSGGQQKTAGDPREKHSLAVCRSKCVTLSSDGDLMMYDIRGTSLQPIANCKLDERPSSKIHFGAQNIMANHSASPCVQFSPSSNEISVSGPRTRGVKVYDITSWSNDITEQQPAVVFAHRGHEADNPESKVTVHTWHPSFHSMILSCDTCGIMHAWQWNHHNHQDAP